MAKKKVEEVKEVKVKKVDVGNMNEGSNGVSIIKKPATIKE